VPNRPFVIAVIKFGGRTVAVIHDSGPEKGRLTRMRARFLPSMGLLRPTAAGLRFEHLWLG
jgi:hypothetical protein